MKPAPLLLAVLLAAPSLAFAGKQASAGPVYGEFVPSADWLEATLSGKLRRVHASAYKPGTAATYVFVLIDTYDKRPVYKLTEKKEYTVMEHGGSIMFSNGSEMPAAKAPKAPPNTILIEDPSKPGDWAKNGKKAREGLDDYLK